MTPLDMRFLPRRRLVKIVLLLCVVACVPYYLLSKLEHKSGSSNQGDRESNVLTAIQSPSNNILPRINKNLDNVLTDNNKPLDSYHTKLDILSHRRESNKLDLEKTVGNKRDAYKRHTGLAISDKSDQLMKTDGNARLSAWLMDNAVSNWSYPDYGGSASVARLLDVPQMSSYCNRPFAPTKSYEGENHPGFKLKMAHVFIRHGDRMPIHHVSGYEPDVVNCNFETWYKGKNEKFQQFVSHLRQYTGKQSPKNHFKNWALHPNSEECRDSDLTSQGVLQHLNNGQHLYDKYVTQTNLFDKKIALCSQIYVRSTGVSRTYQSAIAFLYGFLPTFNVTQANIDFSPNFYFCLPQFAQQKTCYCKHATYLQSRATKYGSASKSGSKQYAFLKQTIADMFEIPVEKLPWLSALMDAFAPAICHNISTPCSDTYLGRCINESLIRTMWEELVRAQRQEFEDPDENYLRYASIVIQPVLSELAHRMKDVVENRKTPKLVIYSGHDLTLSPLLHVLGIHSGHWPPYASRVVIELYEADTVQEDKFNKYFVRILYNGVDMTENVIFCRDQTTNGFCKLKYFSKFVFTDMLRRLGYSSYGEACLRHPEENSKKSRYGKSRSL